MRFLYLLLIAPLFAADPTAYNYDWVNLLEGDSLHLWQNGSKSSRHKTSSVGEQWSVKDGVLSLDQEKEGRGGHIITTVGDYFHFELQFEFCIAEKGNSGIKYRVDEQTVGLEYQIYDDEYSKNPNKSLAALYDLKEPSDRKEAHPAGQEWNSARIYAYNNTIQHWLNGEMVLEIIVDSPEWIDAFQQSKYKNNPEFSRHPGPILIQDHGSNVKYRNMRIRRFMPTE